MSEAEHDAELVRRFLAGDEGAFAEIAVRYRSRMYAVALQMLGNSHDAEEIASDVLIRAHRGLKNFRGDASLYTWLHRIATNLAKNRYWYFWRRKRHVTLSLECPTVDDATLADIVPSGEMTAPELLEVAEVAQIAARVMTRLSAGQQAILRMRLDEQLSYTEISDRMKVGLGTVKSRLARARESLAKGMRETCPHVIGAEASP